MHDTTIDEKFLWSDIKVEGFCSARFDRRDVLSRQEREEYPPFLSRRISINRSARFIAHHDLTLFRSRE